MQKFENILVAFDLNKTLYFRSQSLLPIIHHRKINRLYFYTRPHLKQLVEYLHQNHINYCFWSNMIGKNCIKYVEQLKRLGMSKHCGIFDQQFCDWPSNTELGQKIKTIKNLNKLSALFKIDVENCILVDDSNQKNVEGCHLIHVDSYVGQQLDKDLLLVIEQLKQFRKIRVKQEETILPMLKYTEYKCQPELDNIAQPKVVKKVQKETQPSEIQLLIENDPQLKKFKSDLISEKQNKKNIIKEIQLIQKSNAEMAEQIKRKSQGKVVKKGDSLLLQVLTFAKHKKAAQKKLNQLKQRKKNTEQKIKILKKLMRAKVKQLNPNFVQGKEETKEENSLESCLEAKGKIREKKEKKSQETQIQGTKIKQGETPEAKQTNNSQRFNQRL